MTLRFSEEGPAFPTDLIDRMIEGEVVFLCGAGVSAPQMPMFGALVDCVYKKIGVEPTAAEALAITNGRYEEALGAVSRRLANPARIYSEVTSILTRDTVDLDHHKTLLRLSRARDNRLLLVTTNFECLFERALDENEGRGSGKAWSLAGQALPPPGSEACHGIIHLHGRTRDAAAGLDATPLVLTSAEYGDAYMRSGWASRFLFDLVRCKTLVLVGYSANDAPVRYFLNLLEGDRDRFEDLRTVYALDSYDTDAAETEARWETIAVTPLPYRKGPKPDEHCALWADLASLADVVEQPRRARQARAAVFGKPFATATASELEGTEWLLAGKGDLWDVITAQIEDPAWFEFFRNTRVWQAADAGRIRVNWCSAKLTDRTRLETAIDWHHKFGQLFTDHQYERLIFQLRNTPQPWAQAWKILARMRAKPRDAVMHHFRLSQALESPLVDDRDLRDAILAITPDIEIKTQWRPAGDSAAETPTLLRDIVRVSLSLDDVSDIDRLVTVILNMRGKERRIAQLCNESLFNVGIAAQEAGAISSDWDTLDNGVPAVEAHEQNRDHDGAVHLCVVLSDLLGRIAVDDCAYARELAASWKRVPGGLGLRLWINAQRNPTVFSAEEAATAILQLPGEAFWSMRRELVLAMRERLGDAPDRLIVAIVSRILTEYPSIYLEYEIEGADWRPQARDHRVWLLLTAIRLAGVLPDAGQAQLEAIVLRHPFITGDYRESDLFGSFSTGVQSVQGDPAPLVGADAADRLRIARTLRDERDFTAQLSWSAYCSGQPAAAFEVLQGADLAPENAGLWSDFLQALTTLTVVNSEPKAGNDQLVERSFERLAKADDKVLAPLVSPLSYLLRTYAKRADDGAVNRWWDRLWDMAEEQEDPIDPKDAERFYDRVINRSSGRLAEFLLLMIERRKASAAAIAVDDRGRLKRVVMSETPAGSLGRGAFAHSVGFILHVDWRLALGAFRKRLSESSEEGIRLRTVLIAGTQFSFAATRVFKGALFMAACETVAKTEHGAAFAASKFLHPLFSWRISPSTGKPPLSLDEVRRLLTKVPQSVLIGAAQCFRHYVQQIGNSPGQAWLHFAGPLFETIWPYESRFKRVAVSRELAALCATTGTAFEEAFSVLRHFLTPVDGGWYGVSLLSESQVISASPETCLHFLWLLSGSGASGRSMELATVLDKIVEAAPGLEVDRRLQWLEQNRAIRLA
ncbi:hypothetical protein LMG28614_06952 [Paraburkholderia ultramafica]|uniref:Uncharacterized protein n=1 Tax=Paraburkholderia ultramafica TaxID=1544867 RepID=A0A6S7BQI8_9BURK|nr:SIR2 family protein [Paraburkholderia ultramafica]CAB3809101.1 hypothetical protein LMG28614_06952 [Paraburkholderia ultramafica]